MAIDDDIIFIAYISHIRRKIMDVRKTNRDLIAFWDKNFEKLTPEKVEITDIPEDVLSGYFKQLGNQCENILDVGMGSGYGVFTAALAGTKVKNIIGIDPSENAVKYVNGVVNLSGLHNIECFLGDHSLLSDWRAESFDGIICSNVLDVVPSETSDKIASEIVRLLKPGGLFLLKLNFYLTDELIKKLNMVEIEENGYSINGIMRGLNRTIEEWKNIFDGFSVLEESEYERIPNGPKDRIVLFRKGK